MAARLAIVATNHEGQDRALPVVLQLGPMPHVMRRRADHHQRRKRDVKTGTGVPGDQPARHGLPGHAGRQQEADRDGNRRRG